MTQDTDAESVCSRVGGDPGHRKGAAFENCAQAARRRPYRLHVVGGRWVVRGAILFLTLGMWTVIARAPWESGLQAAHRKEFPSHLTPQAPSHNHDGPPLIDWTPEEIQARPELRRLRVAESQNDLSAILRDTGKRVAAFFNDFPNTTCTEEVVSEICWAAGRECGVTFEGKFRYLLVPRVTGGARILTEYRTDAKGHPIDYQLLKNMPIVTCGFATAAMRTFQVQNQKACRFRYFGRQTLGRQETDVVGFAEIPEKYAAAMRFFLAGREGRLFVQGLAWIDARSHEILRVRSNLLAPRLDLGLEEMTTQIDLSAIHLRGTSAPLRLPTKVVVEVWLGHHHIRNIHAYSHFQLFRVESRISPMPGE